MSISTHVLDTAAGRPVPGVPVRLDRADDGAWRIVAEGVTDADGRLRDWVDDGHWGEGTYRLVFATRGEFFPEVTVVFRVADTGRHYHVPLLLSPYGYTTYRGS